MNDRKKYILLPRDLAAAHCRSASVIEKHCNELIQTDPENSGDHSKMYISVAILSALSIELALKSLHYAEHATWIEGHELEELFGSQAKLSQDEITQRAQIELARPFAETLSEISNVFVVWRYVHDKFGDDEKVEKVEFDTGEMRAISHAVFHVLDDRIKSTGGKSTIGDWQRYHFTDSPHHRCGRLGSCTMPETKQTVRLVNVTHSHRFREKSLTKRHCPPARMRKE